MPKSSHLEEFFFCSCKTLQDSEKKCILFSLTHSQIWLIPFASDCQSTYLKKLTQKKTCAKIIPDLYWFYMSFSTRYICIYQPTAHQPKRSLGPNTKTIYWYESFLHEGSDTRGTELLWKLSKVPKGQNQDQSGMFKSLISHQHSSKPYCKTLEIEWEQRLCTWRQSVCVLHIPHYDLLLWWSTVDRGSRKSLQYSQQFWLLRTTGASTYSCGVASKKTILQNVDRPELRSTEETWDDQSSKFHWAQQNLQLKLLDLVKTIRANSLKLLNL